MITTFGKSHTSTFFWKVVGASFFVLVLYRLWVHAPVWFDEIIAKTFIFGVPVWLFAWKSKLPAGFFGFDRKHFWSGAFAGLAVGGTFGFIGLATTAMQKGKVFIPYLFASQDFWTTFGLAFATAWWESLFFYGLVLSVLQSRFKNEWKSSLLATGIFVLFHAPVLLIRGGILQAFVPLLLLFFFAFGQAIIFLRTRSVASAVVSHAFWGMVLLVYTLR